MAKPLTYDAALEELQEILTALQSETIKVDELEQKATRAQELLSFCKEQLRKVEENVNKIV